MNTPFRLLLPLAVLSLTGAAPAADSTQRVAPAFGNTVLSTYPDGRTQKVWLRPDGSWDGQSRRGKPLAGRWSVKDDKVCLKQSKPPTLPLAYCSAFPSDARVGVSWTAKDMAGTPIQLKLVKGMSAARASN
jgi:hypothetical protein